jgi:zinc protease
MGLKGTLINYRAEPNLSYSEIELAGLGKMQEGFDGKIAWAFNAMQGPQVKTGDEKAAAAREARFHSENWKEDFRQVQTLGVETVEGRPCYKVQMTPHTGSPSTNFYDQQSGFLLKTVVPLQTAMGEITAESLPSDYRKAGGVSIPFKVIQKVAGQVITMTFTSLESNVPIPQGTFDLPAEIKAHLGK